MKNYQKRLNIFSDSEVKYMNDLMVIAKKPYLTNSEIVDHIKMYRDTNDVSLLHIVIANFIKLLVKKARKYKRPGVNVGDLIHYGLDGLIEAIQKSFNLNAEEKFITYITIILERRMKDGLDCQKAAVILPKNIMTQQRKFIHLNRETEEKFSIEEEETIDSEKEVENVIYSKTNIDPGEVNKFRELIGAEDEIEESIDSELDRQSLQFDIFYILEAILTPVERDVIIHYFGLNGESAKAFDAISSILDISAQKVRKIRGIAIEKIKTNPKAILILEKYFN